MGEHYDLREDLGGAADAGQLFVEYQPVFRLEDHHRVGIEALARWEHPVEGVVSPGVFIPLAEETGAIVSLGAWVLEEACRQAREFQEQAVDSADLWVSVNISFRQLADGDFDETVLGALRRSGLAPESLVLEFAEEALLAAGDEAASRIDLLAQLRAKGVRIAADDVGGTGAEVGYLRGLALDVVKIDRACVAAAEGGTDGSVLAEVIALGRDLGAEVVAEGVETVRSLFDLIDLQVDLAQGFLLDRPRSSADVRPIDGAEPGRSAG